MDAIKITWHGHACYTVEHGGYIIALDPYDNTTPGYNPLSLTAHKTLCSHSHHDHSYVQAVCMPLCEIPCPFEIETVSTFHDDAQGAKRGTNLIHILKAAGMKIVHLGDLGHLLTDEQAQAIGTPDVLITPVGGYYTIDASQADQIARQLGAKIVIPMHYRSDTFGYDKIARVEEFTDLRDDVTVSDTNTLTLTPDSPAAAVVLKYLGE
ncbi:MAG: MBL fold metallo-hydrolase [Clostridia bacterium]|nr:MBL fold metallo-hydrolase [Clostridia bacterium]